MTKQEARRRAEVRVYVNMNRGDIEDACQAHGIKVIRNRSKMEQALIEAIVAELCPEE